MVNAFQFSRLPRIFFRNGGIGDLASLAAKSSKKIILVTGESSFVNTPAAEKLFESFIDAGLTFFHVTVAGEPTPEIIDRAVNDLAGEKIDLVAGIGGGSVLDAGKAISAMMYKTSSVKDYIEGVGTLEHPGTKLPYIAVPTTSGTGSESTKNAVISQTGINGFKKSLRHDNFVPDIAIIDPLLTVSCPPELTAACGMDCFTQLTEAFLSVKSNNMTDALALEGFQAIRRSLKKCYDDGHDYDARADMSYAALSSGICLANAGLGTVHGFASSIGGFAGIPHGQVCATLMAAANEINVNELRRTGSNKNALKKYAALGKIFLDENSKPDDYSIDGFINYLVELTEYLKLPRLGYYGLKEEDFSGICLQTENKNNPVSLGTDQLMEILLKCL